MCTYKLVLERGVFPSPVKTGASHPDLTRDQRFYQLVFLQKKSEKGRKIVSISLWLSGIDYISESRSVVFDSAIQRTVQSRGFSRSEY